MAEIDKAKLANALEQKLQWGRLFWKPLHDRQDFWYNMYLLLDLVQMSKPLGFRRFVSNDPRTALDAGVSILTRNEAFWRIAMPAGAVDEEERGKIGRVELGLAGVVDDIDEMFLMRGEMRLWKQVAFDALMRGWIWGKFHVTKEAVDMGRPSAMIAEMWDSRQVLPSFDGIGLAEIIVEKHTTLGELINQYPDKVRLNPEDHDLNAQAVKLEYWSNKRKNPGIMGVLAAYSDSPVGGILTSVEPRQYKTWIVDPFEHEFTPEQLPVVGVPVNGIPIKSKPFSGTVFRGSLEERAGRLGTTVPSWHDPSGWVAETGRGILSAVEENIPQYNELVATALQHFSLGPYPTWAFHTTSGEAPNWLEGLNAKIPLRIGETVERFDPVPVNSDAWQLLALLRDERQRGMLANILQASSAFQGSGVVLQQTLHAALNALEPFSTGMADFGRQMGTHVLEQLKVAGVGVLNLVARSGRSFFAIDFDPKTELADRKYKPLPIFRPSLPEDMLIKAQTARILLDPRRPVMSLASVLDKVLQLDDPEGEEDRIFADIANLDPVIVLQRVAEALRAEGEDELADRIEQEQVKAVFIKEMQFRQMLTQGQGGGIPGPGPETGSPTATGGGQTREGQGQAQEARAGIGETGERAGV